MRVRSGVNARSRFLVFSGEETQHLSASSRDLGFQHQKLQNHRNGYGTRNARHNTTETPAILFTKCHLNLQPQSQPLIHIVSQPKQNERPDNWRHPRHRPSHRPPLRLPPLLHRASAITHPSSPLHPSPKHNPHYRRHLFAPNLERPRPRRLGRLRSARLNQCRGSESVLAACADGAEERR